MIVGTIHGDMLVFVFVKRCHKRFEVFLATGFAHKRGGEVRMHPGAVPVHVFAKRLAMPDDIHTIIFAKAHKEITGNPHLVGSTLGSFAENLELPLAFRDFSVDAFMVDAGIKTQIKMLFDDLAGDVTHRVIANTGVVETLRVGITTPTRETEGLAVLVEEIFLFETE